MNIPAHDLLKGTVIIDGSGEIGTLKKLEKHKGVWCWKIDFESRGLTYVQLSDVQKYQLL